ncbi:sensor histidine kinase [Pedobacter deserti]|uniref:sensor histidine kinase n=1 Tax=Pedobacter deserti TaxID=2817382 RepID=UPI00210E5D1D|nr:sensor histidine kinase [Pedobacter sp. SYSU D00382]
MRIPSFTGSDVKIMFGILIPYVIILNFILFGGRLFSSPYIFFLLLVSSLIIKLVFWQFHTLVAVLLRKRYPADAQIMKRIGIALLCFYLMTAAANSSIVYLYASTDFLGFRFELQSYLFALGSGVVLNTFTTLVHEGVSTLEKWKATLTDTERLRTEYAKSRLEGLKNQIRPHFLFNSINTLSALISEDAKRAETFLDEMCMVYRYLLRGHTGYVPLREELEFIRSYFFILKARFGQGLQTSITVRPEQMEMLLPPFTLQLLMEDILQTGTISKRAPLCVAIQSAANGIVLVTSVPQKTARNLEGEESPLGNLINKFRLLGVGEIQIADAEDTRIIFLPLLCQDSPYIPHEHI